MGALRHHGSYQRRIRRGLFRHASAYDATRDIALHCATSGAVDLVCRGGRRGISCGIFDRQRSAHDRPWSLALRRGHHFGRRGTGTPAIFLPSKSNSYILSNSFNLVKTNN